MGLKIKRQLKQLSSCKQNNHLGTLQPQGPCIFLTKPPKRIKIDDSHNSATHTLFSSELRNRSFVTGICSKIRSQDEYRYLGQEFDPTDSRSPDALRLEGMKSSCQAFVSLITGSRHLLLCLLWYSPVGPTLHLLAAF